MEIKIVTWNMNYWQQKQTIADAWDYLLCRINPDIALVQEAPDPAKQSQQGKFVWRMIHGHRKWGSGILTKSFPIEPVEIESQYSSACTYTGALMGCRVIMPDAKPLYAFSMYGLLEKGPYTEEQYSTTTLHRMLSDMTFLLVGLYKEKARIVLGGDLNCSLQCDEKYGMPECYTNAHRHFFERLEDFGLTDCYAKADKSTEYIQTLRYPRSDEPWQNDYLFVSRNMIEKVKSCNVLVDEDAIRLSDHNPVVITLDL